MPRTRAQKRDEDAPQNEAAQSQPPPVDPSNDTPEAATSLNSFSKVLTDEQLLAEAFPTQGIPAHLPSIDADLEKMAAKSLKKHPLHSEAAPEQRRKIQEYAREMEREQKRQAFRERAAAPFYFGDQIFQYPDAHEDREFEEGDNFPKVLDMMEVEARRRYGKPKKYDNPWLGDFVAKGSVVDKRPKTCLPAPEGPPEETQAAASSEGTRTRSQTTLVQPEAAATSSVDVAPSLMDDLQFNETDAAAALLALGYPDRLAAVAAAAAAAADVDDKLSSDETTKRKRTTESAGDGVAGPPPKRMRQSDGVASIDAEVQPANAAEKVSTGGEVAVAPQQTQRASRATPPATVSAASHKRKREDTGLSSSDKNEANGQSNASNGPTGDDGDIAASAPKKRKRNTEPSNASKAAARPSKRPVRAAKRNSRIAPASHQNLTGDTATASLDQTGILTPPEGIDEPGASAAHAEQRQTVVLKVPSDRLAAFVEAQAEKVRAAEAEEVRAVAAAMKQPKRGRGRPRKIPGESNIKDVAAVAKPQQSKRGQRKPVKVPAAAATQGTTGSRMVRADRYTARRDSKNPLKLRLLDRDPSPVGEGAQRATVTSSPDQQSSEGDLTRLGSTRSPESPRTPAAEASSRPRKRNAQDVFQEAAEEGAREALEKPADGDGANSRRSKRAKITKQC